MCENGNAFPPCTSLFEHGSAPPNSKMLLSKDETWFAVDIGSDITRDNAVELARAYENFYRAAKTRSLAFLHVSPMAASSQSRAWLLRPVERGTNLHQVLCSTSGGILRSIVPALYLNILLCHWRHHYAAAQTNPDEFAQLCRIMHNARLAQTDVALVWSLVTDPDSYRIHHPPSAWLLNRLLRVESRLSPNLQQTLKTTLIQFLMTDEIEYLESSWPPPEQFRSALMAELNFAD